MEVVATPTAGGATGGIPASREWVYSDDEAGELEADWSSNVAADMLQKLSKAEKERQEIINGKEMGFNIVSFNLKYQFYLNEHTWFKLFLSA